MTPAISSTDPSVSSRTSSGSAKVAVPPVSWASSWLVSGPMAAQRVGQQVPVVGMDPAGGVVRAADRCDGEHVVEVAVGQHHRDRLQAVLGHQVAYAVRRIHPGVEDQALGSGLGGDDVAVRLPGTGRKGRDEHTPRA